MAHIFHNPHRIKLPKSQHEVEEFSAKKGLVLCSDCGAAYYKKHWHHSIEKLNLSETGGVVKKDTPIKFLRCPACVMIKNKQYEGRVIVQNLPEKYSEQLEKLVEGFGRRAYERDPMDRIIEIKKLRNEKLGTTNWEITLTENELANKLVHKIRDVFNKVKIKRIFSAEPNDVSYFVVELQLK